MAERQLTDAEQRLLDTIYDSFRGSGIFPIFQWIDTELDASGIDAAKTLNGLPPGLILAPSVGGGVFSPEVEVRLYVRGLRECSGAEDDIERFLDLLRYLVRREQAWRPPGPTEHAQLLVTSEEVRGDLAFDDIAVAKAWSYLRTERGLAGGGGGNPLEWSFQITPSIRAFRNLSDIDEYLERQPDVPGISAPAPATADGGQTYEDAATVVGRGVPSVLDVTDDPVEEQNVGDAANERESTPAEFAVTARALSDLASDVDYIGFEPLVDGIHALLDEPRTELPLAIAVTGPWGAGKSSLMRQLRARLAEDGGRRKWHVVDFDAWKYEKSERLWAALTKAIYEQPQRSASWLGRLIFRSRLEAEREGWMRFLVKLIGPLLLMFVGLAFLLADRFQGQGWSIAGVVVTVGGALATLASRRELLVFVTDPFRRAIDAYTVRRRFERELGFTSEADRDVEALTTLLTRRKDTALAIFVDDLDRCSAAHVVEVVEAINQIFNASRERECVFILGMDVDVVAASIAAAYADTVRQLGGAEGDAIARAFGRSYMAKIVQLTVAVPMASERQMQDLLRRISMSFTPAETPDDRLVERFEAELGGDAALEPEQVSAQADALRDEAVSEEEWEAITEAERRRREQALADSPLVGEAELEVVRFLEPNPRRLKQFDNAYRLQLYVANRTPVSELRFDLDQLVALAKWIVLRLRWPDVARVIDAEPDLLAQLEAAANNTEVEDRRAAARPRHTFAMDEQPGEGDQIATWLSDPGLLGLLREEEVERRLSSLPLASFLHIL